VIALQVATVIEILVRIHR